jgi:hypothetical protein
MTVHLLMPLLLGVTSWTPADVTLENPRLRLVLNDDATCRSLMAKPSGRECVAADAKMPIAVVRHSGRSFDAKAVAIDGDRLTIGFANTDTTLTYAVERADDWIVFRLESIAGTRPESLTVFRAAVAITENVGPRLNAAWDEQTVVCLMAANRQADCHASGGKLAVLAASTQDAPGPKIEGAAVALIACPTPELRTIARQASHAFGLLTNEDASGTPVKDTRLTKGSYWFLNVREADVDKVIDYCRRAGVKQVMMGFGSWGKTAGHYLFREDAYPHGLEGLKAVVDKLHRHGILVGMHTFVSKVSKTDPYVTPVPDKRFWKDRETKLADPVTADQTEIRAATDLSQWPGSPVCSQKAWEGGVIKHQEVIIGDEIVQYQTIGPEGKWDTFLGCRRGFWGTKAAPHALGDAGYHFGVDGCINGYIIDQETSLMDEVADRIAGIFNTCGFDMVYFDGGEDVNTRRFNYHVSNFQEQAMRRFTKRPIIHMGTIMTHLTWHSFARSATVDTYLNTLYGAVISGAPPEKWPTVREHIDRSVQYMLSVRQDMMPGELGWFGIWPKGPNTDGLQLDEVEYLMCKSLGYDVPISLQTDFSQMEAHPLTPEILNIVREYETLRMAGAVPEATWKQLQELGKDFALIRVGQATSPATFVPVEPVPLVGGTHDVRALVGAFGDGSVATMWHTVRDGQVLLKLDPAKVMLTTLTGEKLKVAVENGKPVIPVDSTRHTLICRGVTADELRQALAEAEVRARQPEFIFLRASDCRKIEGEMALGSKVGTQEPEALSGDVIVCTGRPNMASPQPWYAEYTVSLPHDGRWTLWARVRYPSGVDDSFGIVLPGDPVTLTGKQVLGNCGVTAKKWHWTGQGYGTTSVPPGQPITFNLKRGPFTFRIHAREGPGTADMNPRLDLLCLADEPDPVPTDEMARAKLEVKGG